MLSGDELTVISCDGCGACCRHVVYPPFFAWYPGVDPSWDRLEVERPDLAEEIKLDYQLRRALNWPEIDTPCLWYDAQTGRCRHYEYRPDICYDFEVGAESCLAARRRHRIG